MRYLLVAAAVSVGFELLLRSWMGRWALPVAVALGLLAGFGWKHRPRSAREAGYVLLLALCGAGGAALGLWLTGLGGP